MRTIVFRACVIAVAAASGTPVFVSAQTLFPVSQSLFQVGAAGQQRVGAGQPGGAVQQPASAGQPAASGQKPAPVAQPPGGQTPPELVPTRRLSADDAVKLAVENNLGLQIARVNPQLEDLSVLQARTAWSPSFTTLFQKNSADAPNQSFLAGAQGLQTSSDQFLGNLGITQRLPWGGSYDIGWDSSRFVSNSSYSTFSPRLSTSMALAYTQPLLRNWNIDSQRQQLLVSSKNREIADIDLRQTLASTIRTVRNA